MLNCFCHFFHTFWKSNMIFYFQSMSMRDIIVSHESLTWRRDRPLFLFNWFINFISLIIIIKYIFFYYVKIFSSFILKISSLLEKYNLQLLFLLKLYLPLLFWPLILFFFKLYLDKISSGKNYKTYKIQFLIIKKKLF